MIFNKYKLHTLIIHIFIQTIHIIFYLNRQGIFRRQPNDLAWKWTCSENTKKDEPIRATFSIRRKTKKLINQRPLSTNKSQLLEFFIRHKAYVKKAVTLTRLSSIANWNPILILQKHSANSLRITKTTVE